VLVGLPTLNHADVGPVVRAAHVAFGRELARERTALINVDGGSSDGTPDLVRDASIVDGETLLASQSLRTRHRISSPYHGVPGKAAALRAVFAAADLLQARAVVVLDPEVASVTPESVAALARPALAGAADFVSPAYARHALDGPLVAQVVRPLFRAAYGLPLQEPLAGEFGCSGDFAARCLEAPAWESDDLRLAIDLWISGMAADAGLRVVEVGLGPRRLAPRARPGVAELVPQVLDALLTCLRLHETRWTARALPVPVTRAAAPPPPAEPAAAVDGAGYAALFREGLEALGPMLEPALRPTTLEAAPRELTAARSWSPTRCGRPCSWSWPPRIGTPRSHATTCCAPQCPCTWAASRPSPPRRRAWTRARRTIGSRPCASTSSGRAASSSRCGPRRRGDPWAKRSSPPCARPGAATSRACAW
jgi:hypothetical protein